MERGNAVYPEAPSGSKATSGQRDRSPRREQGLGRIGVNRQGAKSAKEERGLKSLFSALALLAPWRFTFFPSSRLLRRAAAEPAEPTPAAARRHPRHQRVQV